MFSGATAFNQNIGNWNISNVASFVYFMASKTNFNYSATNLDAIYNGWSALPILQPSIDISFGSIKRTTASTTSKTILTSVPNNWIISDGEI